jgi:hypothetical protein
MHAACAAISRKRGGQPTSMCKRKTLPSLRSRARHTLSNNTGVGGEGRNIPPQNCLPPLIIAAPDRPPLPVALRGFGPGAAGGTTGQSEWTTTAQGTRLAEPPRSRSGPVAAAGGKEHPNDLSNKAKAEQAQPEPLAAHSQFISSANLLVMGIEDRAAKRRTTERLVCVRTKEQKASSHRA